MAHLMKSRNLFLSGALVAGLIVAGPQLGHSAGVSVQTSKSGSTGTRLSHPAAKPPAGRPEQVVKALYAAFDAGDMAKVRRLIAPDATWTYYGPEHAIPFAGTRKGPDGVADFFAKVDATLRDAKAGQRDYIVDGDQVAVPGTEESTVKETGEHYLVHNLHLFKITNGKIVRFEEYIDSGAVMEAFTPADPQRGRALFTTCAGCHGNHAEGRPEMFAPNLTGQSAQYLVRQLRNFRRRARGRSDDPHGFAMHGRAIALPGDRGVRDVVAYITSLPPAPVVDAVKAGQASQRGAQIFETCAACHGPRGEGSDQTMAPSLRGLSASYIVTSLNKFRSKIRGYDPSDAPGATMGSIAQSLSPSDLNEAASYIAAHRDQ